MKRPDPFSAPRQEALQLAERIERETLDWPRGSAIGAETQLLERYQVSRGTLRQAVRCLERRGVAQMKRGAAGGLVVDWSTSDRAIFSLGLALEMQGPSLEDLSAVGSMLKREVAGMAARRADASQSRQLISLAASARQSDDLAQYAERRGRLLQSVALVAGDRAFAILIAASTRAIVRGMPIFDMLYRDFDSDVNNLKDADCAVAAAVASKDEHGAQGAADISAGIELASFRRAVRSGQLGDPAILAWRSNAAAKTASSAHRIAWTLRAEIQRSTAATPLGSEKNLAARFGVGRAVMREALRMLADFGLVAHRRGSGGGVFSSSFDPWTATRPIAEPLRRTQGDLWGARMLLEGEAARLISMHRKRPPDQRAISLYLVEQCPNSAMATLIALLSAATEAQAPNPSPFDDHLRQAILERDAFFARRFAIERCVFLRQA